MKARFIDGNVRANCPNCGGAMSTFERKDQSKEFGHITSDTRPRIIYMLLRCAGCGRGGMAKVSYYDRLSDGNLEEFFPYSIESAEIPGSVPQGIEKEFREAELTASVGAWRAASALFRSVLEKALKDSGYTDGKLYEKINTAATDGVITEARRDKAHDNIRVLGNDVVHDEWRVVTEDEVEESLHYTQRILEDLYDDRERVVKKLEAKGRLRTSE